MSNKNSFFSKNIGNFFILFGLISLAVAIDYQNSIAIVVGATTMLWGGILIYIKDDNYVKTTVLENTCNDLYSILDELYDNLLIIGKPVYYFEGSLEGLNLVHVKLNTSEKNNITLIAPGQKLHRSLETALDMNFSIVDLFKISEKLEKIIIENFNLASSINLETTDDNIRVNIIDNIFTKNSHEEEIWEKLGDPLTSAIACIITRSKGKKLVIDSYNVNKKETQIVFKLKE